MSAARTFGSAIAAVMMSAGYVGFGIFEVVTVWRCVTDSLFWAIFVFTPPGWIIAPFYAGTWLLFFACLLVGLVGRYLMSSVTKDD